MPLRLRQRDLAALPDVQPAEARGGTVTAPRPAGQPDYGKCVRTVCCRPKQGEFQCFDCPLTVPDYADPTSTTSEDDLDALRLDTY